ncbi:MAG TPA: TIGR03086 family metal-binding protein [Acidimicrobiales bacterium]|nr:TIGR03086 family metal-binding protein [Acidimicrobiales bacterium]
MSAAAERFRKHAATFTDRVVGVPPDAWANPAPPEGWTARDVVRHLVEWIPGFWASNAGIDLPQGPPVDDDPVGAWRALRDGLQAMLDDPAVAARELDMPMGRMSIEQAVDMICTSDVFLHTWDLARATGQDETLDPDEVHTMLAGMEPMEGAMRASEHYGPRVEVPDDADEQTRLIAFIGRRP